MSDDIDELNALGILIVAANAARIVEAHSDADELEAVADFIRKQSDRVAELEASLKESNKDFVFWKEMAHSYEQQQGVDAARIRELEGIVREAQRKLTAAKNRAYIAEQAALAKREAVSVVKEDLTTVPADVMAALDRMCTPLDDSWLGAASETAKADARCMALIRSYILSNAVDNHFVGANKMVPDLWSFLRDVLRQGAAIESQQGGQGYETFVAHIEAEACRQEKKLRAMLAASQPAQQEAGK